MSRSTTVGRTAAAVVTAAALAGSGLATASAQAASAHASSAHASSTQASSSPTSAVTAVRIVKHVVHMPTTVRAGLHTFRLKAKNADLQIVKIRGHYTKQEFVTDYNKAGQQSIVKNIKRLEKHVTFIGGGQAIAGHPGRLAFRLPRGTFWAIDSAPDKIKAKNVFVGRAVGRAKAGTPTGTATITAVDPNRWSTTDSATIPGSGTLLFKNDSTANHFVVIIKLAAGKTVTDFGNWVTAVNAGKATFADAPVDETAQGYFNSIVSPGRSLATNYSLPAGSYVVACFYPDADMGGMLHVFMGMYRGITVQ